MEQGKCSDENENNYYLSRSNFSGYETIYWAKAIIHIAQSPTNDISRLFLSDFKTVCHKILMHFMRISMCFICNDQQAPGHEWSSKGPSYSIFVV